MEIKRKNKMSEQIDKQQKLIRISELVTLRDDLQAAQRENAGTANAIGFAMRVPERNLSYIEKVSGYKRVYIPSAF